MSTTEIPIVIRAFRTVKRRLAKGAGRVRNWRTNGDHPNYNIFRDRPEYWEESWWLEETCCHLDFSERSSDNASEKNSEGVK